MTWYIVRSAHVLKQKKKDNELIQQQFELYKSKPKLNSNSKLTNP